MGMTGIDRMQSSKRSSTWKLVTHVKPVQVTITDNCKVVALVPQGGNDVVELRKAA
jgi:hypothetical protein